MIKKTPQQQIEDLIDNHSLELGDVLDVFAARRTDKENQLLEKAKSENDELEFDANAYVALSEGGAYVMSWVWVKSRDEAAEDGTVLMKQVEARKEAKRLNAERQPGDRIAIAHRVPIDSWAGKEKGWSVGFRSES